MAKTSPIKKLLRSIFCKEGYHIFRDVMNTDEAWHECTLCGWQIEFSKEEYEALKSLQQRLRDNK